MKAHIEIVKPQDVMASITITLSVEKWVQLRDALKDQPFHGPAQAIRDVVWQLTEAVGNKLNYTPHGPDEKDAS